MEGQDEELTRGMSCEEVLVTDGVERGATGQPVHLGDASGEYLALIVPGLGWECLQEWLKYEAVGQTRLADYGFESKMVPVSGISSSETNARQIWEFVQGLEPEYDDRKLILIGYSKGTPDVLIALVEYPGLAERTAAVISLGGAVGGSPMADDADEEAATLANWVPGADCEASDKSAVASLRTSTRRQWLEDNDLPSGIRYYSVIANPDEEHVSRALMPAYKTLGKIDPRNDSQLLIFDQMIPGSTLLAYLNADHLAVGVPIEEGRKVVASVALNHNRFPRELLLEAVIRFVEDEDQGAPE
jgi:pimeloyl-ACP methyl ester carboxylesterase